MKPLTALVLLCAIGIFACASGGEPPVNSSPQSAVGPDVSGADQDGTSRSGQDSQQLESLKAEVATLKEQLRLWGDRGRVDLVESIIYDQNPSIPFQPRRDIAKAFVKAADKYGIPLLAGVAIADVESNFSNHIVGSHGEASLMQILPLPGRPSCEELRADPSVGIYWALENCFAPAYHQTLAEGKSEDEAIKAALKKYNDHDSYVEKVFQRYQWMKGFEAKGLYGWN